MTRLALVFLALAVVMLLRTNTLASDPLPPPDKALIERIEVLEKLVIRDPFQPKETVLARLDAIQATLKDMAKAGEKTARVEGRDDQEIKRDLESVQKSLAELDRRIKTLEAAKPAAAADNTGDIRDLKRSAEQLGRSLEDLKDRVKRLEATR